MNKKIGLAAGFIIMAGIMFYAGMKYGEGSQTAAKQGRFQQLSGVAGTTINGQRGTRGGVGGGFSGGEIIAKDDKSITVKTQDGGSKIIFFSGSTPVMKSTAGTAQDLTIGEQITANGTANADGSITAQSIQIRPAQKAGQ